MRRLGISEWGRVLTGSSARSDPIRIKRPRPPHSRASPLFSGMITNPFITRRVCVRIAPGYPFDDDGPR